MKPAVRRMLVLLLAAGAFGWSYWQGKAGHATAGHDAAVPASAGPVAPDVLRVGSLSLDPCNIGAAGSGVPTLRAYCTLLAVPEDRAQPQGRQLHLRVAVVRSLAAKPDPDPVVFLDGGPGGAATDDFPSIAGAFEPLRRSHDIVMMDQRGTGASNALRCKSGDGDATDDAGAQDFAWLKDCVQHIRAQAAPEHYATLDAAQDLEALRQAIGAPRLDLVGVSYGTRLAQQYARVYPQGVRALVLDSPVPNDLALGSEHARNLEDALRALFARCRARQDCHARYGDPYATLKAVQAHLRAHPEQLELRDPRSFEPQRRRIGADALATLVRLYAYNPHTAALLPYVLSEAQAGRYAALLGQAEVVVGDVEDHLTGGLGLSVGCAEDADRLAPRPADVDTVLGNSLTDWMIRACALWPHGARPAGFGEPLRGNLPVLVLAGEADPVTPPRYGEAIVRTLGNARLLTLAGQGHGQLPVGCMPRLVDRFLRTLDARGLDARCLDVLGQTPAFLGANGAAP
jgi:pimeloyl-ACP methyl ester carboxylesterase